jgi:protein SCO1
MSPMRLSIAGLAAAAVLLAAGCGGASPKAVDSGPKLSPYRGIDVVGAAAAPNFTLRDQAGRLVRMSDQRGRFTLVTFLYTHCPDVCPLIAEHLNTALERLGATRNDTRVLAVSVDPKGDTAGAVRSFVAAHRLLPQFRYLRGSAAQLEPVWAAYHIAADPLQGTTAIGHSAFVLLVDRQGVERLLYDSSVKAGDIVHDIDTLKKK